MKGEEINVFEKKNITKGHILSMVVCYNNIYKTQGGTNIMNELQIANLEQSDITTWDFTQLKDELGRALSVYKTTVYTDENIKLAKDDKAKLSKAKKIVEDRRKAFKTKCMEPYEALEPQIKELVSMIDEQYTAISEVVKDYTERQKAEKETEIRAYYDKKAHVLGDWADPLYEKILDQKWLTASSGKKYKEEIQVKINEALADIRTLMEMKSPFIDTVIERYVATLSVDEAKAKHEELVIAASKAGLGQQESQPMTSTTVKETVADTENETLVKMYGNKRQISQVMDFAKAIGVKIEIQ